MVELDDIVVSGGEGRLEHAFECLGDASNFGAVGVLNVEVPRPPVLGVDRTDLLAAGHQAKRDLAEGVLLDDLADLITQTVVHDDAGLHELGRTGEPEHDVVGGVHDLQMMGEELHDRGTSGLAGRQIPLKVAGIVAQVLVGGELQWVDEDRREHDVVVRGCGFDQAGVTRMQEAHGWHHADPFALSTGSIEQVPGFGDRVREPGRTCGDGARTVPADRRRSRHRSTARRRRACEAPIAQCEPARLRSQACGTARAGRAGSARSAARRRCSETHPDQGHQPDRSHTHRRCEPGPGWPARRLGDTSDCRPDSTPTPETLGDLVQAQSAQSLVAESLLAGSLLLAGHPNATGCQILRNRWPQFEYLDGDFDHPRITEQNVGDALGEELKQREPAVLDQVGELAGQRAIVNRVGQVVADTSRRHVGDNFGVDFKRLAPGLLLGEHTTERKDTQPLQKEFDRSPRGGPSVFVGRCFSSSLGSRRGGRGHDRLAGRLVGLDLVHDHSTLGADLLGEQALDHDRRVGHVLEVAAPDQEAANEAHDGVIERDAVHEHRLVVVDGDAHLLIDARQIDRGVFAVGHRPVAVCKAQLLVCLEVVRARDHRNRQVETIVHHPDDFFLATDRAVAGSFATQSFADRELVLENPQKVTRLNSLRPLAAQARNRHFNHQIRP
ncbi:hypothetical protein GQR58_030095 [Nymphon striatum]|nr:hypothetical protein GQR58_030095 [Nymphon striatum]